MLRSSLRKLYGRNHDLVDRYEISISQMTMNNLLFYVDFFFRLSLPRRLLDLTLYMSNTDVCLVKSRNWLSVVIT